MTTYTIELAGANGPKLKAWPSKKHLPQGNGYISFTNAESLLSTALPTSTLVQVYNSIAETPVQKFESKVVAAERLIKILGRVPTEKCDLPEELLPVVQEGEKVPQAAPVQAKAEKSAVDHGTKNGKHSPMEGKVIRPLVAENPRREHTHGHKSMQIILTNVGIMVEEFVQLGGRLVDLRWDIAKGNVKLEG